MSINKGLSCLLLLAHRSTSAKVLVQIAMKELFSANGIAIRVQADCAQWPQLQNLTLVGHKQSHSALIAFVKLHCHSIPLARSMKRTQS